MTGMSGWTALDFYEPGCTTLRYSLSALRCSLRQDTRGRWIGVSCCVFEGGGLGELGPRQNSQASPCWKQPARENAACR